MAEVSSQPAAVQPPPKLKFNNLPFQIRTFVRTVVRTFVRTFVRTYVRKTLNGRLPLKNSSYTPQTFTKHVLDDPRHFIFPRKKKCSSTFVRHFGTLTAPQRSENARKCSGMIWKQSETSGNVRKCPKIIRKRPKIIRKRSKIVRKRPNTLGSNIFEVVLAPHGGRLEHF